MPAHKFRTVLVAFCIGVLLGGAVFAASRLLGQSQSFSRSVGLADVITIVFASVAVIVVAYDAGRGWWRAVQGKSFDPDALPHDPLLDLPMRRGFELGLLDAVKRAAQTDRQVGLILVDLRGLRAVNDLSGHAAGDEILTAAAQRLRKFANGSAGLSRIGGDEFAIVVEKEASAQSLRHLADRIRRALVEPYPVGDGSVAVGASLGAALYPVNAEDATGLFRAASAALSRARAEGRSALAVFDTAMGAETRRRVELEHDLKQALAREQFVIFYQPQLELASGKVRGYEALVRWERLGHGILSPRDFLDVAEETGLIAGIGEWVLRKACRDAATWLDSATVAVNLGTVQFRLKDIDQSIAKVLRETGLQAERLEIEVPESLFLKPSHEVLETLNRIKGLGVRIVMDDFGASYSSLASLAHFPFDKIKIDKSFVGQLAQDADVAAVVASIVGLGRSLSVDVTAEGVETAEQVTLLKAAGCSIVQGFLFGMPKRDRATLLPEGEGAREAGG